MPNVGYIESGELSIERSCDGRREHFVSGQVIPEMVDMLHRGHTGESPAVLIVFYAGIKGEPLSK